MILQPELEHPGPHGLSYALAIDEAENVPYPFKISLAPSYLYESWRIRYLWIESRNALCSEDEFKSRCLWFKPRSGSSNVRRLAPLLRFTSEHLYKYSKYMMPKRYNSNFAVTDRVSSSQRTPRIFYELLMYHIKLQLSVLGLRGP